MAVIAALIQMELTPVPVQPDSMGPIANTITLVATSINARMEQPAIRSWEEISPALVFLAGKVLSVILRSTSVPQIHVTIMDHASPFLIISLVTAFLAGLDGDVTR